MTENKDKSGLFSAICSEIGIFKIFGENQPGIIKIYTKLFNFTIICKVFKKNSVRVMLFPVQFIDQFGNRGPSFSICIMLVDTLLVGLLDGDD